MGHTVFKYLRAFLTVTILLAVLIIMAGPAVLKAYIETGIGTCRSMPLLCTVPQKEVSVAEDGSGDDSE